MTTIVGPLPNQISDGQVADAVPVMNNFNWLLNQVNANGAPNNVNFPLPASGSLINIQILTGTGTYTPTTGTSSVIEWLIGAGGAGGGCPATGASQDAAGGGGGGGGFVIHRLLSGFVAQTYNVGVGGVGTSGGNGGAGGTTGIGVLTASGGAGGFAGTAGGFSNSQGGAGGVGTGGNTLNATGQPGNPSCAQFAGLFFAGPGGSSFLSGGAQAGTGAAGVGGGGGGQIIGQNTGATTGFSGANGVIFMLEYA